MIVGSLHAGLAGRTLVYTISIFCLRFSALAGLSRRHSVLILLGLPRGTPVLVISASLLSVIANGTASRGGRAIRERVCGKYDACQQRKNFHGDLRVSGREAVVTARAPFNSRSLAQFRAYPPHTIARKGQTHYVA